ncbi:MAG: glycerophosphoryl diester phosphodiesterase membrane domain-containing protein [Sphingomonadales bacterium]|nr:glycerophosphoryl diester phosphodiesterase membrane domain-containing protein [Sphingomonadales bacterium]
MARLSISRAWDETRAFLARETRLVLPVALAFIVLPAVAGAMFAPSTISLTHPTPGLWLLAIVVAISRLLGLTVITRLALGTHESLAATIRAAAVRLPALLGLLAIILIPVSLIAAPLMLRIVQSPTNPPPGPSIGLVVLALVVLAVFVRLSLVLPVAMAGPGGALAIAKRSFALTKGNFWRLFGTILLLLITRMILSKVVQVVIGSLLIITLGPPRPWSVSLLLLLLALQLVDVVVSILLTVLLARVYAQCATVASVPR